MPLALIKPVRQSSQNGTAGGEVVVGDARVRMLGESRRLVRNSFCWKPLAPSHPSLPTDSFQATRGPGTRMSKDRGCIGFSPGKKKPAMDLSDTRGYAFFKVRAQQRQSVRLASPR